MRKATRKVTVTLDEKSISDALDQVRQLQNAYRTKAMELCKALAEAGAKTAQEAYNKTRSRKSAVVVTVEPIENGYSIVASGDAVCFLEFGAGDALMYEANMLAVNAPFPIYPGSYSEQHAQQYSEHLKNSDGRSGWWMFGGYIYTEVKPLRGLEKASAEIRSSVFKEAERIFGGTE